MCCEHISPKISGSNKISPKTSNPQVVKLIRNSLKKTSPISRKKNARLATLIDMPAQGPLWWETMTSFTKPEVPHRLFNFSLLYLFVYLVLPYKTVKWNCRCSVSYRIVTPPEKDSARPQAAWIDNLVNVGRVVREICSQTARQTRSSQYSAPSRGGVIRKHGESLIWIAQTRI